MVARGPAWLFAHRTNHSNGGQQMKRALTRVSVIGAIVALAAMLPTTGAGARSAASVRVAADHLNNPRGVSVGLDGRTVYVTEAGNGGLKDHSRCDNVPDPESGDKTTMCLSLS